MEIADIPTEMLLPNPCQPRKVFDSKEMLGLADSVKQNGVLQPLIVRQINRSEYYEVIAGERRLRASILAGLQTVPCIVRQCDTRQSAVFSILENIQRSNLNFFEEAVAIDKLQQQFGITQEEIGKMLGKSQPALSNKLRLLKLPLNIRQEIIENKLTERHARALLRLNSVEQMQKVLNTVISNSLNVKQTEDMINAMVLPPVQIRHRKHLLFKDVRIFVNTFNKAIDTMKQSGIPAISNKTETNEYIEFRVRIPKSVDSQRVNSA